MALQDDPPESARHDPAARKVGRRGRRVGSWLTGILLLLALVLVVRHLGEGERLVALLREVRPGWLVVATALQLGTYVCAAAVWHRALAAAATRPRLRELVPLGLAKLFTDQAIPSAGVSGTVLVVRALGRRGIPRGRAMSAMLVSLASYYLAYGLAVAGAPRRRGDPRGTWRERPGDRAQRRRT